MNGSFIRADNKVDKQFKQNEVMIRESLENYEGIKEVIRDKTIPDPLLRQVLFEKFSDELGRDLPEMRALLKGKVHQVFKVFVDKFSYFRQFTPELFSLLALQSESIDTRSNTLKALDVLIQLNKDNKRTLPRNVPLEFIPKKLKKLIVKSDGSIDRHAWECALYLKLRDEIKQGNINASESKRFASIKSFYIENDAMKLISKMFFDRAGFPEDSKQVPQYFTDRLEKAYLNYFNHEVDNDFAKVVNGKWVLGSDPALRAMEGRRPRRVVRDSPRFY